MREMRQNFLLRKDRRTDRRMDRQTDGRTDRQTDRQTDTQTRVNHYTDSHSERGYRKEKKKNMIT